MKMLLGFAALAATVLCTDALADGVPVGFNSVNLAATGTPSAIISPSANLHGAYLRTCNVIALSAAGQYGSTYIAVDTTTPPLYGAQGIVLIASSNPSSTANAQLSYPLYVAPGYGVWTAATATGSASAFCTYDLL